MSDNKLIPTIQLRRIMDSLVSGKLRELRAIELLEEHSMPKECAFCHVLARSKTSEVRARAMELLGIRNCKDSISILIKGLKDPDFLVRTAAVESLGQSGVEQALKPIIDALKDRSHFVRSAAALSLSFHNGSKVKPVLLKCLHLERNPKVRLRLLAAQYALGVPEVLVLVTDYLRNEDYRNRCAAANILARIAKSGDKSFVIRKISDALSEEPTLAARSSMKDALRQLRGKL